MTGYPHESTTYLIPHGLWPAKEETVEGRLRNAKSRAHTSSLCAHVDEDVELRWTMVALRVNSFAFSVSFTSLSRPLFQLRFIAFFVWPLKTYHCNPIIIHWFSRAVHCTELISNCLWNVVFKQGHFLVPAFSRILSCPWVIAHNQAITIVHYLSGIVVLLYLQPES